jgi:hypothetical protein
MAARNSAFGQVPSGRAVVEEYAWLERVEARLIRHLLLTAGTKRERG